MTKMRNRFRITLSASIDFDQVWRYLPHLTVYQLRICMQMSFLGMIAGIWTLFPVFGFYTPKYTCISPLSIWCNQSCPFEPTAYDSIFEITENGCSMRTINETDIEKCLKEPDNLDECLNDHLSNSSVSCSAFSYDATELGSSDDDKMSSMVTKFDLVCENKWIKAFLTSMVPASVFIGAFLGGPASDYLGRKPTMGVSVLVASLSGLISAFMSSWWSFLICWIFIHVFMHIGYVAVNVYAVEILGPNIRQLGIFPSFFFAVGWCYISMSHYWLPNWRDFTIFQSLLGLLYIPLWLTSPESPRFHFLQNRNDQASKVLKKILKSKVLHHSPTEKAESVEAITEKIKIEKNNESEGQRETIMDIVQTPQLLKSMLIMGFIFCGTSMVYYGLGYNAAALPGSVYVNNFMNGLVEILSYIISMIAMKWIGRRTITAGTMIIGGIACGICGILFQISSESSGNQSLVETGRWISFVGKFLISATFGIIWVYVCELYPTTVRGIGTSTGSMSARIGAISAPYFLLIPASWVPYIIFSCFSIVGGILALLLDETHNREIPNTVAQMKNNPELKLSDDSLKCDNKSNL